MMYVKRQGSVWASELAEYLNLELVGNDFIISGVSTITKPLDGSVLYINSKADFLRGDFSGVSQILILTPEAIPASGSYSFAVSENPRLDFVLGLDEFLVRKTTREVHPTAHVAEGAVVGRNVHLGANVSVGPEVTLEDNVTIHSNAILTGRIHVGANTVIKENSVIGSEGYAFVTDYRGNPIHVPHIGSIFIGASCWIGANTTIERAEIEDTIIGVGSKIDDMVHIGGACRIGERVMITAGTVIGNYVIINDDCWLAPNTTVKENVTIGSNVMLGIGSAALHDLEADAVYVGTPAKYLKKR